jgi:predicted enzyme related to lactoylglutathione lyase
MNPVVHFEMPYEDPNRVANFYKAAFGWKMKMTGAEMGNYVLAHTTATSADGMIKTPGTSTAASSRKSPTGPRNSRRS